MATDIRVLDPADIERWKFVQLVSFMGTAEELDRWCAYYQPEWTLAAFVNGELQASVTSMPYSLTLEGSTVRMGGVTSVACAPEYRRHGLVKELLLETLKRSRDIGEPLSGLWTPHPALYRRYGWEICVDFEKFSFNPKQVALEPGPRPAGSLQRATADDWKAADGVYRKWGLLRNSLLVRSEARWRVLIDNKDRILYVYRSPAGDPEGFAILQLVAGPNPAVLIIRDLLALSPEAYRALLSLALSHDLVQTVEWSTASDEPFLDIVADPGQVKRETGWALHLRIVDVAEAFSRRPAYGEGRLALKLVDSTCPWNDGVWEIASAGSHFVAERVDDDPALTLDARALAQLYNGYRSATNLARAGRIQAHHPRALAIADIMFAMRTRPVCLDDF